VFFTKPNGKIRGKFQNSKMRIFTKTNGKINANLKLSLEFFVFDEKPFVTKIIKNLPDGGGGGGVGWAASVHRSARPRKVRSPALAHACHANSSPTRRQKLSSCLAKIITCEFISCRVATALYPPSTAMSAPRRWRDTQLVHSADMVGPLCLDGVAPRPAPPPGRLRGT